MVPGAEGEGCRHWIPAPTPLFRNPCAQSRGDGQAQLALPVQESQPITWRLGIPAQALLGTGRSGPFPAAQQPQRCCSGAAGSPRAGGVGTHRCQSTGVARRRLSSLAQGTLGPCASRRFHVDPQWGGTKGGRWCCAVGAVVGRSRGWGVCARLGTALMPGAGTEAGDIALGYRGMGRGTRWDVISPMESPPFGACLTGTTRHSTHFTLTSYQKIEPFFIEK